jgi:ABC-type Fe3+/spermidine/putrescine transport system ATPase subunit
MDRGIIAQVGTPQELYGHPASPTVRDFMGKTVLFEGILMCRDGTGAAEVALAAGDDRSVRFRVAATGDIAEGDRCYVAIRPERVVVRPRTAMAPGGPDEPNHFPGVIEALLFLGDRYQAQVRLVWGQELLLFLPAAGSWNEGQAVSVELLEKDATLWPV